MDPIDPDEAEATETVPCCAGWNGSLDYPEAARTANATLDPGLEAGRHQPENDGKQPMACQLCANEPLCAFSLARRLPVENSQRGSNRHSARAGRGFFEPARLAISHARVRSGITFASDFPARMRCTSRAKTSSAARFSLP
jgi:hypothetical protein